MFYITEKKTTYSLFLFVLFVFFVVDIFAFKTLLKPCLRHAKWWG